MYTGKHAKNLEEHWVTSGHYPIKEEFWTTYYTWFKERINDPRS